MKTTVRIALLLAVSALVSGAATRADTQFDAYRALGIEPKDVLVGTVLNADVVPDWGDEVVAVVTFFTGQRAREQAVDVRFAVLRRVAGRLEPVVQRAYGERHGGKVGRGELQVLDLDRDGIEEIVVTYDDASDPLVRRRRGEVHLWRDGTLAIGWEGEMAYDATRDARGVPGERRDRWSREIDVVGTMRTRGLTLYLTKTVYAVAGETLARPKQVSETFPLRSLEAR
jgi:hypothetical protein